MFLINYNQYKFLKRISENNLEKSDLTDKEIRLCKHFVKIDLIETYSRPISRTPSERVSKHLPVYPLKLTPHGESVVSNFISDKVTTWVPIFISIVALVFSFIALFK